MSFQPTSLGSGADRMNVRGHVNYFPDLWRTTMWRPRTSNRGQIKQGMSCLLWKWTGELRIYLSPEIRPLISLARVSASDIIFIIYTRQIFDILLFI